MYAPRLVSEQLRLQQRLGDRPAVDRDERAVAPAALRMDGVGEELLAGPALALDEHRGVGPGDPRHDVEDLAHLGRVADEVLEPGGRLRVPHLLSRFGLHPVEEQGAAENDPQRVDVDGLRLVVESPGLHRPEGVGPVGVPREDHDPGGRRRAEDLLQGLQPFLSRVGGGREAQVEGHYRRLGLAEPREGLRAVPGEDEAEFVPQRVFELGLNGLVVLDDQQPRLAHGTPGPRSLGERLNHGRSTLAWAMRLRDVRGRGRLSWRVLLFDHLEHVDQFGLGLGRRPADRVAAGRAVVGSNHDRVAMGAAHVDAREDRCP